MLNEIQKNKFTIRAKNEAKKMLNELGITNLNDNNIGDFETALDVNVSGLVTLQECQGQNIDVELLKIYDLLTDIILDNEDDFDFLNSLFFN